MSKLFKLLILSTMLFSSYSIAQTIFDAPTTAPPATSLTPTAFTKAVTDNAKAVNADLTARAKALLKSQDTKSAASAGQQTAAPPSVDNSFSVGAPSNSPPAPPADTGTGSNKPASSGSSGGFDNLYP